MRPREDRRPSIRSFVWRAKDLTWREKAYLIRVVDLPAEPARRGSKAMGWDGKYALHVDYIAEQLGANPESISDAQKGCQSKGYLSLVFPPAYGRPATYEAHRCAQDVADARAAYEAQHSPEPETVTTGESRVVTNRQNTPRYGIEDPSVTRGETPPVTYRGGTQPHHAGSRPSPHVVAGKGSNESTSPARDRVRAEVGRLEGEQEERSA